MKINKATIDSNSPPYIIAEMSANHNGSIENAKKIISLAKKNGASAVKMQTYTPDTITLNSDNDEFMIKEGLWKGKNLYELYSEAYTPWEWHEELFAYALELGITIFSSPFDKTAVDLLEKLEAPAYKIASFEAIDLPLIEYVAKKNKPMIISTGMADFDEINEAVNIAKISGCKELAILHCVSGYPAPASDYNLATIRDMKDKFKIEVGLSDHTLGISTSVASIALGATIIEKHFTLDRSGGGPDDSFSLEPDELGELVKSCNVAWQALGQIDYGKKSSEMGNIKFRRSLYYTSSLKAGEKIKESDFRSVRPGYGLEPKFSKKIIGKKVKTNIEKFTAITEESIDWST